MVRIWVFAKPQALTAAVVAFKLKNGIGWWDKINESPIWQDRIFYGLAVLFGIVALIALVNLPPFFCLRICNLPCD